MMRNAIFTGYGYRLILLVSLASPGIVGVAEGARPLGSLDTVDAQILADSPEDFGSRIYSYDMAIDDQNNVHIVYSRPFSSTADQIIYARRIDGAWSQHVISSNGLRASISTEIEIDPNGTVHVCYIRANKQLYYHRIQGGVLPGVKRFVGSGAWNTRMQLDENGQPVFVRENQDWPSLQSKLVLLRTANGLNWTQSDIAVPRVTKFRVADFLYRQGTFRITYGDSSMARQVLIGKGETSYKTGIFHNLYYAESANGNQWDAIQVDTSGTLYEDEFWTTLAVDGQTPIGAVYRYAEVDGQYNTGTSLAFFRSTEDGVVTQIITSADYAETREGMGAALLVEAPGEYLGVWDFSPDDTQDPYFRGERGNIALARNGEDGQWKEKLQVDAFSAEGRVVFKKMDGSLHILVLGDFVDAKLYYRELDLAYIKGQFDAISGGFPWNIFLPAILGSAG